MQAGGEQPLDQLMVQNESGVKRSLCTPTIRVIARDSVSLIKWAFSVPTGLINPLKENFWKESSIESLYYPRKFSYSKPELMRFIVFKPRSLNRYAFLFVFLKSPRMKKL